MTRSQIFALALGALGLAAAAVASETINYKYDARGRLIQVERNGTATGTTNNVVTNYTIDRADNRTNKTTTGSPNSGPPDPPLSPSSSILGDHMRISTLTFCTLLASICLVAPAMAQEAPPPLRHNIDANGVDVVLGTFNFTLPIVSIGPEGEHGLHYARTWDGDSWVDDFSGSVFQDAGDFYVSVATLGASAVIAAEVVDFAHDSLQRRLVRVGLVLAARRQLAA